MAIPPPTLVRCQAPVLIEGPPELVSASKRLPTKVTDPTIEDVVNSVLPPRMWNQLSAEGSSTWMQYVSKEPASRLDVLALQESLDERLAQRQARDTGICPVRDDLYRQCFDEVMRQVTIDSPERGLLLLRVRDEIRMTVDAYKTLFESSIIFGVRKQAEAELGAPELEAEMLELADRKRTLEAKLLALRNKIETVERRQAEWRVLEEKRRQEELSYLKHQAKHLDLFLKNMPRS